MMNKFLTLDAGGTSGADATSPYGKMAFYLVLWYDSPINPTAIGHAMASPQPTFSDLEQQARGHVTRRQAALELLDAKVPWASWRSAGWAAPCSRR